MKTTCEINDYSIPAKPCIKIHNAWSDGSKVEVEVEGERYIVDADELISAVRRCKLDAFEK